MGPAHVGLHVQQTVHWAMQSIGGGSSASWQIPPSTVIGIWQGMMLEQAHTVAETRGKFSSSLIMYKECIPGSHEPVVTVAALAGARTEPPGSCQWLRSGR